MLAMKAKHEAAGRLSAAALTLEKSRLNQARTLALRRKDFAEVAELDTKLTALTGKTPPPSTPKANEQEAAQAREQRAKLEAMRKAEQAELERRRKERSELLMADSLDGTATPPIRRIKALSALVSRSVFLSRLLLYTRNRMSLTSTFVSRMFLRFVDTDQGHQTY